MGVKVPKLPRVKVDPAALRKGIWGNTWKQWGWIVLAFLGLYALLAGYQTGMMFAAKGIRQDNYRTMSGQYFGPFDRALFTADVSPLPSTGGMKDPHYFNRPDGCMEQEVTESLPNLPDVTVSKPTGILECSNSGDQWRWTVYPWVADTNGLGQMPGCSNPEGTQGTSSSYLSSATSPAAADAGNATEAEQIAWVCANSVAAA